MDGHSSCFLSLVSVQKLGNVVGPDTHVQDIGKIHFVQFDSDGVFGWILKDPKLIDRMLKGDKLFHCVHFQHSPLSVWLSLNDTSPSSSRACRNSWRYSQKEAII